ncbi:hypothetical protein R1sor_027178 [Riccia sorocarpa]|uniref:Reverse transcriptase domain-containing protein n=1 Tax=Riccia sorocarpa TaxID=122646 RepID=A0ABD3GGS4_9MARC
MVVEGSSLKVESICFLVQFGSRLAFLLGLSQAVLGIRDQGPVWVCGDFNGRTGEAQSSRTHDPEPVWRHHVGESEWVRTSVDSERNGLTTSVLQFASVCGLTILNGVDRFAGTQVFTCFTANGASVVDYVMASDDARDRVLTFLFGSLVPESDHRPLLFTVLGFVFSKTKTDKRREFKLDKSKSALYRGQLESQLVNSSPIQLPDLMLTVAKKVFSRSPKKRQVWFDDTCRVARDTALSCPLDGRPAAFTQYKRFIRAKKRRFIQAQQLQLKMELAKDPQSFWKRLQLCRTSPELTNEALLEYVKRLYFDPADRRMPVTSGTHCVFQEHEVAEAVRRMKTGKAADLGGLSLELVRWGGPEVISAVTRLFNLISEQGIPTEWAHRYVIPLYKNGPKNLADSYRTIMIAHTFAKIWGSIIRVTCWNIRGLSEAAVEGNKELWELSDIVALVETWCTHEGVSVVLPGFTCIKSVWNEKHYSGGRGYGGIAVWAMLLPDVGSDPRDNQEIISTWEKISDDQGINQMATPFLQFLSICDLIILNGTRSFPDTKACTYTGPLGSSLIDYLVVSQDGLPRVTSFTLGDWTPESDHRALCCILTGFSSHSKPRRRKLAPSLNFTVGRDRYERAVSHRLQGSDCSTSAVTQILLQEARSAFSTSRIGKQSWFDDDCLAARKIAMTATTADRHVAFRKYNHLIRAKKRRFVKNQQAILREELLRTPQDFWKRLSPPQAKSLLPHEALQQHVSDLYFFPNAVTMPLPSGPGCIFSEEEVITEISRMKLGRAADLFGLNLEMLRWGGRNLHTVVTNLLNSACQHGFPDDWSSRKVIPLHKSGPKTDPKNYRTIMIAHVLAKLFGRLLESRLSLWCEDHKVRAPAQAGFRRGYSTLDHAVTLRALCEESRITRKPLFILFVDFSRAFDSVCRNLLWTRLSSLGVPDDLINAITILYQKVLVKRSVRDEGIASTLGVIQGCSLSPTLFGLFLDDLYWKTSGTGVKLGSACIRYLLFADDLAIIALDEESLRQEISQLEEFCNTTGMQVNLKKTMWMRIGPRGGSSSFKFLDQQIKECRVYKYLGIEFSANLSWSENTKSRVSNGLKALYSFWNQCRKINLVEWGLRKKLFVTLVQTVVLYGVPVWGPSLTKSS